MFVVVRFSMHAAVWFYMHIIAMLSTVVLHLSCPNQIQSVTVHVTFDTFYRMNQSTSTDIVLLVIL